MKNFITTFFLSTILLLSLSVGLIIAIDPYDKLGNNLFNFKTKAVAQSRENKFHMFEASQKRYEAFILGSSAAHRYPTQKVEELTGYKTFNYAVQHSTPIDYLAIIKHILSKSVPKLLILQLDFAGLDETYKVDNRLFNSPLKKYLATESNSKQLFDNSIFTLDSLRDSFRVIFVNKFGKARHIYLEDGNYVKEKKLSGNIKIKQSSHEGFIFSYERLQILKDIKDICAKNNIKLITLSSPLAIGHIQKINSNQEVSKSHQLFKKEMINLFENFWDFENNSMAKYNSTRFFRDSTHPSKEMSEIILSKILAK